MRKLFSATVLLLAYTFALAPNPARAQTPAPPSPSAPPKLIAYHGLQLGVDVTVGRQGEVAFYTGASSKRSMLAVRISAMDAGVSVPCSLGVMYEHMFARDRARITPVAGASFARVFSCADDSDGVRATPAARSVGTFSGGVRVPMFAGHHVVGSLKVLAFGQRQFGDDSAADTTSRGVTVGFVIGRR